MSTSPVVGTAPATVVAAGGRESARPGGSTRGRRRLFRGPGAAAVLRAGSGPTVGVTVAVLLFRATTFWGRVPDGWLVMTVLRRQDVL